MLATLETGIEGGKWFRLIDKVWSPKNLAGSLQKVVPKAETTESTIRVREQ